MNQLAKFHYLLLFSFILVGILKKLGRVGKDRPTGIDFLEEASASPTEKIPEPWPRPDTGGRRHIKSLEVYFDDQLLLIYRQWL